MSVRANIHVDFSQISDMKQRNAAHLPRVKNAMARRMAEKVRDEAIPRAPFDASNTTEPHLREQIRVIANGLNNYTVEAERIDSKNQKDVALLMHEGIYTPSDPSPLVGRRYLARAIEDNEAALDGIIAHLVDDYLNSL